MRLIPVDPGNEAHLKALYELLEERTPEQSISHKAMPTWEEHLHFVERYRPRGPIERWGDSYLDWCLVDNFESIVGAVYLTSRYEIGVSIFRKCQRRGFGQSAVTMLVQKHAPLQFLANINPANEASRRMFEKLGFRTIQHTLALETGQKLVMPVEKITAAEALKRWPRAD